MPGADYCTEMAIEMELNRPSLAASLDAMFGPDRNSQKPEAHG
jgi:hypothetical protein